MSTDAGSGAPEGGQEGNENGAGAGAGTATAATGPAANGSGFDPAPWEAFATKSGLTVEQVEKKLGHARTWEKRASENHQAAQQLPTLQQQLDDMQKALADRDVKDVERAGRLAMTQVYAELAQAGIRKDDVAELLEHVQPTTLLKNGDVDDAAVKKLAAALSRTAGRPVPDDDQGRRGDGKPGDMNDLFRHAMRRR